MQKLKGAIKRNLVNVPSWRKIVAIESDDWGQSIYFLIYIKNNFTI